jgi:hypothetical protein
MSTQEKLRQLTRMHNKRAVSIEAGLAPNSFRAILTKKQIDISARTAAALARVLGVDLVWLLDDSRGFPEVRVANEQKTAFEVSEA